MLYFQNFKPLKISHCMVIWISTIQYNWALTLIIEWWLQQRPEICSVKQRSRQVSLTVKMRTTYKRSRPSHVWNHSGPCQPYQAQRWQQRCPKIVHYLVSQQPMELLPLLGCQGDLVSGWTLQFFRQGPPRYLRMINFYAYNDGRITQSNMRKLHTHKYMHQKSLGNMLMFAWWPVRGRCCVEWTKLMTRSTAPIWLYYQCYANHCWLKHDFATELP